MAACRSCGALITWIKLMPGGGLHPLDPEPRADGNIQVNDAGEGRVLAKQAVLERRATGEPELYRSHFATCPQAGAWRKG